MAKSARAYVDTSALIAFLDRSDTHHDLFRRLFAKPPTLLTTPLVVGEGQAWFLRRYDPTRSLQFMAFLEELETLEIVSVGANETDRAKNWLRRFPDQKLTLADAVGLDLMKRSRIRECWSTDRHLSLGGARLAIHQG